MLLVNIGLSQICVFHTSCVIRIEARRFSLGFIREPENLVPQSLRVLHVFSRLSLNFFFLSTHSSYFYFCQHTHLTGQTLLMCLFFTVYLHIVQQIFILMTAMKQTLLLFSNNPGYCITFLSPNPTSETGG